MPELAELVREHPIAGLIAACEIGLWVLLALGLGLRYLLGRRRAGAAVLACIPLLDVVLIVAAAVDLGRGAEPTGVHGLAAIYLGVSVAFGPAIVRWADVRVAHRFAGGPPPVRPAKGSPQRVAALWREWARVVLAAAIASAALLVVAFLVAEPGQRGLLLSWVARAWVVAGLWLVFGPLWEEVARRRRPSPAPPPRRPGRSAAAAGAAPCDDSR